MSLPITLAGSELDDINTVEFLSLYLSLHSAFDEHSPPLSKKKIQCFGDPRLM